MSGAQEIVERGFTVLERAYPERWIEEIRADIVDLYERELGAPETFSSESRTVEPGVVACVAGLALHDLLRRRPRWIDGLFTPQILATVRGVLGERARLEVAGCVISDASRPFFAWHTHVGAVEDGEHRKRGEWPAVTRAERVMTFAYLEDLGSDNGPMLVQPRRVGDMTSPPFDPDVEEWPAQVELKVPRGTVVFLEQCTWHAVRQKTSPGLRVFLCCTFARDDVPPGDWRDPMFARMLDGR